MNPSPLVSKSEQSDLQDAYDSIKTSLEKDLASLKSQSYSLRNPFRNKLAEASIPKKITESYDARKLHLENESFEQDIKLKKQTLNGLFWFLAVETFLIFFFAWCQGIMWLGFYLEEWSFRLLVSVTITQITIMLLIAVKHLFPKK